jgi:NAD(P)H-quinone oxidoreductase subunit 5
MEPLTNSITALLAMAAPIFLLLSGLVPSSWANANPRKMASINMIAAWLALASALLVIALFPFETSRSWHLVDFALPFNLGNFSVSIYVNSVTVIMLSLVAFVGVIVSRYSRNYLDGEINQGRFHKWLSLTLASILTLIISGNLLMFVAAWIATSLCLHQLLVFYRNRPAAVLAAHKKFVASRIGDLSLLSAVFLINDALGTMEFEELFGIMENFSGELPAGLEWAAVLVVIAAALKSAQFPFHGWLIQVMEAPTPVSALLHAGIVNAGAFLVIRMSPVISHSNLALGLLALIGLITLALAAMVMLTQTSVKVSLAWSTTAQMGFMLLECGLGLYSLAMLHLVAHSVYKAHAFLASGSVVDGFRAPSIQYKNNKITAWRKSVALVIATTITGITGYLFGITFDNDLALFAVAFIVVVALTQLLLQAMSVDNQTRFFIRATILSLVVCTAYFALHHIFELIVTPSVLPAQNMTGTWETILVISVIAVFAGLLAIQQSYKARRTTAGDALYVHLYNGFYIDVFITRMIQRLWPAPTAIKKFGESS